MLCGIGIGVYFVIDNNKKIPDKKDNIKEEITNNFEKYLKTT